MVELIHGEEYETDLTAMAKPYREFREKENIPVHGGIYIKDLDGLETGFWERTGQRGALVNLDGMEGLDDIQILEIEPGGKTNELSHFHYKMVWVIKGQGLTRLGADDDRQQFEWQPNSVFVVPRNTPYEHVNLSNSESAKLVCVTDLPQVLDIVNDEEFVFESEYDFWARSESENAFDHTEGRLETMFHEKYDEDAAPLAWVSNFIPDVTRLDKVDVAEWNNLGAMKVIRILFPLLNPLPNRIARMMHISSIPVGTYKRAHRHNPGANVFISDGEGYTLLWSEQMYERENVKLKLDWGPRSVFTPPGGWWHHHFNLDDKPAKQFAFHAPPIGTTNSRDHIFDSHASFNRIRYVNEDEATRQTYQEELEKRGIEFDMPEECYTDPEYRFEGDIDI